MPLPNEHSARQLPPNRFDRVTLKRRTGDGGIVMIVGRLADSKKYAVQTVRGDSTRLSVGDFRQWLVGHNYRTDQIVAAKKLSEMKAVAYSEVVTGDRDLEVVVDDDLSVGKPFKTLACGPISSRMTGEEIGVITPDLIKELVRVYHARRDLDPVIIDWCHASSDDQAPIENTISLGQIVDMYIEADCLWCVPAYSDRGQKLVNESSPLWSSPEFLQGDVYDRRDGSKVGAGQILAISLTPRPQQTVDKLTKVTLSEDVMENENMAAEASDVSEVEAIRAEKEALEAEVERLRAELESMKASAMAEGEDAEDDEKDEDKVEAAEEVIEEDDEKDEVKLRERLLLSEQQGQIKRLSDELASMRREQKKERRQAKIRQLCELGKISPAEVESAERLYNLDRKLFADMFETRPANSAVNLSEFGHGYGAPEQPTRASVDRSVKKLAEDRSVDYATALKLYRESHADEYLQAMKGGR